MILRSPFLLLVVGPGVHDHETDVMSGGCRMACGCSASSFDSRSTRRWSNELPLKPRRSVSPPNVLLDVLPDVVYARWHLAAGCFLLAASLDRQSTVSLYILHMATIYNQVSVIPPCSQFVVACCGDRQNLQAISARRFSGGQDQRAKMTLSS